MVSSRGVVVVSVPRGENSDPSVGRYGASMHRPLPVFAPLITRMYVASR